MAKEVLYATGFFEIGDFFIDQNGQPHIVTDILVCHYIRHGDFRVFYELDSSGEFADLRKEVSENANKEEAQPVRKPNLQLLNKDPFHFEEKQ